MLWLLEYHNLLPSNLLTISQWRRGGIAFPVGTMAGLLRKIGEFDSATEDWTSYLERLTHYLATNGIAEEKKKDTFLCCVGIRETFGLLRALVAPQNPGDKTFIELTDALTIHLAPKPLVIAERFYFHKR